MLATLAVQQVMFNVVSPRILSRSVGVHLLFVATPSSSARASPAWVFRDPVRRDRLDLPPLRLRVAKGARPLRGRGVIAAGARRVTRHPRHERRRIEADALGPLERARRRRGPRHRPERNWSGASHSITLFASMPPDAPARRAVGVHDRRTIDCVRLPLGFLGTSPTSSSWINRGANLGDDITYWAPCGGDGGDPLERPSIAVSLASISAPIADFRRGRFILEPRLHARRAPERERAEPPTDRRRRGHPARDAELPRRAVESTRTGTPTTVGGSAVDAHAEPGTDIDAVRRGKISVTDPPDLRLTRAHRGTRAVGSAGAAGGSSR